MEGEASTETKSGGGSGENWRIPHPGDRVTVVTPTTEQRQDLHYQLYAVFDAQDWPDKELVVIETYTKEPSPFFTKKATEDSRIIFHSMQVDGKEQDLSIGIKRNMGTHLASGDWIASFDDDDLYAPVYLTTMIDEMVAQKACAITLGSWYIFEERSGMFGYVDCRRIDGVKVDLQGRPKHNERDGWLYGFGFSYVFNREIASDYPFPDKNMGEDYDFFIKYKARFLTAVLFDDFGICVHTLHPRSTSCVQADQEVSRQEISDLDVMQLGDLVTTYMDRYPRKGVSINISAAGKRMMRQIVVHVVHVKLDVPLTRALQSTVKEIKHQLAEALQCDALSLSLYSSEEGTEGCLRDDQRLGVRATRLWAREIADTEQDDGSRIGVRVVSAGYSAGNVAEFYVNDVKVPVKASRGLNLVVVHPVTWETRCGCYDVWGRADILDKLVGDIDEIPDGHHVLVGLKDSGLERLGRKHLAALHSLGARIKGGMMREGYALIGTKGGFATAEKQGQTVTVVGILRREGSSSTAAPSAEAKEDATDVVVECVDAANSDLVVKVRVQSSAKILDLRDALISQHLAGVASGDQKRIRLAQRAGPDMLMGLDLTKSLADTRNVVVVGLGQALGREHEEPN